MLKYPLADPSHRPLPLHVSSKEFARVWRECWDDHNSDLTYLLEIAKPYLEFWESLLLNPERYPSNIHLISGCRLISPESVEGALQKIHNWITWTQCNTSIMEELQYCFIETIRKQPYLPHIASPHYIELMVSMKFKYRLFNKIESLYCLKVVGYIESSFDNDDPNELAYEPSYPDIFLSKLLNLTPWDQYLFDLLAVGATTKDVAKLTHINYRFVYYKVEELWDKLGLTLYDNSEKPRISRP